jgi:RecB family endonuclease NucS
VNQQIWVAHSVTAQEAKSILEQAIRQKRFIQILGESHVEYHGRARSILTEGERLIILKRDGTLLVHKPSGVEPVNWQPSGATFKITTKERKLVIIVNRAKPRETVRITFTSILLISASILNDSGEFSMFLTEAEMQQVLSTHPELIEKGLRIIRRERQVTPGFIDIFARDTKGRLVIVEIKCRRANREAVLQLHNYLKSLQKQSDPPIRGILVAPSLTKGTQTLLEQLGLEFRRIEPQQCYRYVNQTTTRRLTEFTENG